MSKDPKVSQLHLSMIKLAIICPLSELLLDPIRKNATKKKRPKQLKMRKSKRRIRLQWNRIVWKMLVLRKHLLRKAKNRKNANHLLTNLLKKTMRRAKKQSVELLRQMDQVKMRRRRKKRKSEPKSQIWMWLKLRDLLMTMHQSQKKKRKRGNETSLLRRPRQACAVHKKLLISKISPTKMVQMRKILSLWEEMENQKRKRRRRIESQQRWLMTEAQQAKSR